ncbi:M15 family metallopeptidase [Rugamonas sp. CCM 8940]|uniref:M15 family metallopeptidase n=1 Tax=Rugamonas sp. CCM 8940 TaxID=2765359 RepID=UPI0018F5CEF0|nr:M15 family metallopeptidase [Rugamonas sp. CCM 8940]MBJ7310795.1 M15 family metallopeptidase [Rugamonas sp. CCM 8940]
MFIFSVLVFFLLICAGAWLLLFSGGRELVAQSLAQLTRALESHWQRLNRQGVRQAGVAGARVKNGLSSLLRLLLRHCLLLLAAGVLLTVPPLLAWLVSGRGMLGGFEGASHDVNPQVLALLQGEQLVPPTPLPPPAFVTTEVAQLRPMLDSANRNWRLLDAAFAQRLLTVFKIMKETHGYDMAILEGYRSPQRQDMLATAGPAVTNARAFQSYHQFGLAADCAFLRDGKLVISEKDPWAMRGYRLYGEVAEAAGLHWGGRWTMMDFGHTELRLPGTVRK